MARTRQKSEQIDWNDFSNNIKSAANPGTFTPTNGINNNFASNGAAVSFTVESACTGFVTVIVSCQSTSDFEHRPQVWLNGTLYSSSSATAAVGGGVSNRGVQRSHSCSIALPAGTNTISAGMFLSSGTSQSIVAGAAVISAIVLGNVTG